MAMEPLPLHECFLLLHMDITKVLLSYYLYLYHCLESKKR